MSITQKVKHSSKTAFYLIVVSFTALGCPIQEDAGSQDDGTGSDVGDDCDMAHEIDADSVTDGALQGADDFDFYEVTVSSSGVLRAYTTGTTDTLGSILDDNCEPMVVNDDTSTDLNFDLVAPVIGGGTYYVAVGGASAEVTGAYRLYVEFSSSEDVGTTIEEEDPPRDCWLNILLEADWKYQDLARPDEPPSYETRQENLAIYMPTGAWNGNSFYTSSEDGELSFTISGDRTTITSFSGSYDATNSPFTISGSGLPVTTYLSTLSTIRATARETAACDVVDQFEVTLSENWEMLDFYCAADSHVTLYCD